MTRRLLLVAALLAPFAGGCSSAESTPDGALAQDSPRAFDPAPQGAPADSPPLGNPRPKIAPESALASGERKTIR